MLEKAVTVVGKEVGVSMILVVRLGGDSMEMMEIPMTIVKIPMTTLVVGRIVICIYLHLAARESRTIATNTQVLQCTSIHD